MNEDEIIFHKTHLIRGGSEMAAPAQQEEATGNFPQSGAAKATETAYEKGNMKGQRDRKILEEREEWRGGKHDVEENTDPILAMFNA